MAAPARSLNKKDEPYLAGRARFIAGVGMVPSHRMTRVNSWASIPRNAISQ